MAAISRATLRTTIRNRGDYTNTRRFTNEYLNTEIQTAFGKFYEIVDDCNEGWWDTEGFISTVLNQAYVALPSDCWRLRGVDLLDGGDYIELPQIGIGDRNRFGRTADKPAAHRQSARGLELQSPADGVYTLRLIYAPLAPTLDEDTAREWYNGWEDFVIAQTLFAIDQREQRPLNDRLVALQQAEAQLRAGATKRRAQEPEYLVLREAPVDDIMTDEMRR